MQLREAIEMVNEWASDAFVCARRPWSPEAEAMVVSPTEDLGVPEEVRRLGFEYFLETHLIRELLEDLPPHMKPPRRLEVIIYYAENDAFPHPL